MYDERIMKRLIYRILLGLGLVTLGASLGYFYRDRSANEQAYENQVASLGIPILMMDALQDKKYKLAEEILASNIEAKTSNMVFYYDKYKFSEGKYGRCAVTRRLRELYDKKKIFGSRQKSESRGVLYTEVMAYFASNCKGKPSRDDWTATNGQAKGKSTTTR